MTDPTETRHAKWLFLAALALNVLALVPLMQSGYIGDDALNSQLPGALWERGQSLGAFLIQTTRDWMAGGRFFPVSLYGNLVFVWASTLASYKGFLLGMALLNLTAFGLFVRQVTGSLRLAAAAIALMPALFQVRAYHDALLSYHGLLQVVFLFTIVSLGLFHRFLTTGRQRFLWGSLGLYLASLLTYEITYVFFALHLLMLALTPRGPNGWRRLLSGLPFVAVTVLCGLVSLAMRQIFHVPMVSETPTHAYVAHLDVPAIALTIVRQVMAALPLSYHLFDPHQLFKLPRATAYTVTGTDVLMVLGGWAVLALAARHRADQRATGSGLLLALGGGLVVLPNLLIALSPKYQSEVIWGIGYLPVYISYFGVALLVMGFLAKLQAMSASLPKAGMRALTGVALLLLGGTVLTVQLDNRVVVEQQNARWKWPRQTIERALAHGLLEPISGHSSLYVETANAWDTATFYRMHTHARLRFVGLRGQYLEPATSSVPSAVDGFWQDRSGDRDCHYVRYDANIDGNGYAVAGETRHLSAAPSRLYAALAPSARLFVYGPHAHADLSVTSVLVDPADPRRTEPFEATRAQMRVVDSGPDWELLEVSGHGRWIDLKLVNLNGMSSPLRPSSPVRLVAPSALPLLATTDTLLHVAFRDDDAGLGFEVPSMDLGESFAVEAIVRPAAVQRGYAGLFGNHPGYNHYEGFVLQQDGDRHNRYRLGYGNGSRWHDGPGLTLLPERWQYLAIRVDGTQRRIEAYLDGRLASSSALVEPIRPSAMPLVIANWIEHDRPFSGRIREVRVTRGAQSPEAVSRSWEGVKASLSRQE